MPTTPPSTNVKVANTIHYCIIQCRIVKSNNPNPTIFYAIFNHYLTCIVVTYVKITPIFFFFTSRIYSWPIGKK